MGRLAGLDFLIVISWGEILEVGGEGETRMGFGAKS